MTSLNTMVKKCAGLVGTKDVTPWEDQFLQSVLEKTAQGDNTTSLTEKQVDVLQRLYSKHFEG